MQQLKGHIILFKYVFIYSFYMIHFVDLWRVYEGKKVMIVIDFCTVFEK